MRIADHGFISDCQSSALVGLEGSVDWYCVPRLDSPSVFARLLDQNAGHWHIRPVGRFDATRAYVEGTLVLRTEFRTGRGAIAVTDALALEQGSRGHEIGRRVPHEFLRRIEGLEGAIDVEMEFAPRFEYGLTVPRLTCEAGTVHAEGGRGELVLETDAPLECAEAHAHARFEVRAGESYTYRLGYRASGGDAPFTSAGTNPSSIGDTIEGWRSWSALHRGYSGLYADRVGLSAQVLQGLTYAPTGPVTAAATMSLPERLGGDWNWDYRYAWLRDASLTMQAQRIAACAEEPVRFFRWAERAGGRVEDRPVQIVYSVTGERDLSEHTLRNLEGFEGSRPVRVGNDAWLQEQLDVLGEVLDAAHSLREDLGELGDETREMLAGYADRAAAEWRMPDAGMWEARDSLRHYTTSKVMCWVALDRAVRMADLLGADGLRVDRWERERDSVREAVLIESWNERAGAYTDSFGSEELDASVLLLPIVGFLPAAEPRMRATIEAVERVLSHNGLVRRWPSEPNGFIMCSFWLAECLALAGETARAAAVFERVSSLANDLGLLSEEADPRTGELLGNFPHASSHVGLVNAAWAVTRSQGPAPIGADG